LTFDHHPDEVLRGSAPPLLLDPEERLIRLGREGIELVVVEHFDARLRSTPYDVFVRGIADRVGLAGFVMTPDAAFGFERQGTPTALAALGRSGIQFEVAVVPPFTVDGRPVSSSAIRSAIAAGDLAGARRLLGRAHAVVGELRMNRLRFEMPVALPPPAVYGARVGPLDGDGSGSRTVVSVEDGEIMLGGRRRTSRARLRVAFMPSGAKEACDTIRRS